MILFIINLGSMQVELNRFNTGSGSTASASTGSSLGLYDGGSSSTGLWAGAGTFTQGTSTLTLTGSSKTMTYRGNFNVNNLVINGQYTLSSVDETGRAVRVQGNTFTMDGDATVTSAASQPIELFNSMAGGTLTFSAPSTNIANLTKLKTEHTSGTISIPTCTTAFLRCGGSGGTTQLAGSLTITDELEVNDGTTFNANGNTINCAKAVDCNGSGTLDLRNSSLIFTADSGTYIMLDDTFNLLTGNTIIQGHTDVNNFYAPSDGGFEVVGTVENMNIISQHSSQAGDLTVIGAVINCTSGVGSSSTVGDFIRQWHHTLDTQQLLDADEAGDDDLRLEKPALDNANELQTG